MMLRAVLLVAVWYVALLGFLWMTAENNKAAQRQQTAVACTAATASQTVVALLIAAGWDMRADEMTPIVPTMNELSECDFTFFETDWRNTSQYSIMIQQTGPTTFTGKTVHHHVSSLRPRICEPGLPRAHEHVPGRWQ